MSKCAIRRLNRVEVVVVVVVSVLFSCRLSPNCLVNDRNYYCRCGVPWACGRGEFGRLGVGDEQSRREMAYLPDWKPYTTKLEVVPTISLPPVKSISLGGSHSLALLEDGSVYAWGRATLGRLGVKTDADCITKPTCVMRPCDKAILISAGGSHNAVVTVDH